MGKVERWGIRILDGLDVYVTKIRHKALDEEEEAVSHLPKSLLNEGQLSR